MKDLFVSCPFHGVDRTPSLSILLHNRGSLKAGFAHCFACGWTGNYKQVEMALGYPLDIGPETHSLLDNSASISSKPRIMLATAVGTNNRAVDAKKWNIPFRFSPYLHSRGIGEAVQRFNKVYEKEGRVILPFFNPEKDLLGYVERSVESKFYKVTGSILYPLGIENIEIGDFVFVTEGQIDKMSLEEVGFKTVALGSVSNYRLLKSLKNLNICLAFDSDEAGKKAVKTSYDFMSGSGKNIYTLLLPEGCKDVNELLLSCQNLNEFRDYIRAHIGVVNEGV